MSIVISGQGGGQVVETEYIYAWKRQQKQLENSNRSLRMEAVS